MGEPAFTPGPWRVHDRISFDIVSDTEHVARATINGTMEAEDRCYANALLIAAAPALYAACVEAKEALAGSGLRGTTALSMIDDALSLALGEKQDA